MRAPVTYADLCVAPRTVHVDKRHCRLRSMQRHDSAAKRGGLAKRGIMKQPAEALAFVRWRNRELPERPRLRLSEELNLGGWIGPSQCDGSDDFATKLANKANAARDAFLGIGDRLVGGPIAQTARGVGRIRGVNELGQRMQVIRCRYAPHVELLGHVAVPSNVELTGAARLYCAASSDRRERG